MEKGPAYRIHTERAVIRCWDPRDAEKLKEAIDSSIDHLRPWMPWAENEPQELSAKVERLRRFRGAFDQDRDYVYGIFDPTESLVIGGTGLHTRLGPGALEIGYWIRANHVGRGLATEVAAALTRVAFEINRVARVEIHCAPHNLRSAAVPRRLGFVHEATLRERVPESDGRLRDAMIWSMFAADYLESEAARRDVQAFDVIGRRIL